MITVSPVSGSFPSITWIGKTMSLPLTRGLLLRVTTASVTSPLAFMIETAALGGSSAKEFFPSVTSFMNASRVMCPAVRTGRSQKKMIFGLASLRVSKLPSKTIAFASWTNSMSQASSSARAGEANDANKSTMTNIDFIHLISKFGICRLALCINRTCV